MALGSSSEKNSEVSSYNDTVIVHGDVLRGVGCQDKRVFGGTDRLKQRISGASASWYLL